MKLYTDVFTGTEVLSDLYKLDSDFGGYITKVKASMI